MLKGIVEGREASPLILVEDSVEQSGVGLLKTCIAALGNRCEAVHVVTYEYPHEFLEGFTSQVSNRLHHLDAASDPLGWNADENTSQNAITMETDLHAHLTKSQPTRRENQKVAVVIDCLSNLILHRSATYTCRVLHKLRSWKSSQDAEHTQVVALVHADLHDDVTLGLLQHTANAVLSVNPSGIPSKPLCKVLRKKSSGKITKTDELFTFGANFENLATEDFKPVLVSQAEVPSHAPDPAANLTFNLKLTDTEKEARSQVVLPYTKQQQQNQQEESGKVFYQPDDADDFDDEDPDEDLDI